MEISSQYKLAVWYHVIYLPHFSSHTRNKNYHLRDWYWINTINVSACACLMMIIWLTFTHVSLLWPLSRDIIRGCRPLHKSMPVITHLTSGHTMTCFGYNVVGPSKRWCIKMALSFVLGYKWWHLRCDDCTQRFIEWNFMNCGIFVDCLILFWATITVLL